MSKASATATASSGGMSALGLLGVIFVCLKLFGITAVAEWSWWWVTAPFWGGLALFAAIMLMIGIGAGLFLLVAWLAELSAARRRRARMAKR